ncbi:hypothetical protein M2952_28215, partial [Klebsiella pneumoniae]|uniref:hypothetical protein n=1 Tax=Klebsiella pneumoniae TaxID=573 RepID=UPI00200F94E9
QNDVTLKMPAFEWVHVQLHQQKGMISLSPPTICNSAIESIRARRADPDTFHSIHAKPVTRLTVFNTSVIIGASAPYTFSSEHKRLPK